MCKCNIGWADKRYTIFGRVMCSSECRKKFREKNPTGCKIKIKEEGIC
tara:strand:+ start:1421 stop:1564 length:144 start_codon:yes stop_codon:yes gene_type:complete